MTERLFIDCTDTYFSGLNTGIQRVVRGYATHVSALAPDLDMACTLVVFKDGRPQLPDSSILLAAHGPRLSHRNRLNSAYLAVTRRLADALPLPLPFLRRFLLAHRTQFGLAYLLFAPFRLAQWFRGLRAGEPDRAAVATVRIGPGDILFLPDATWSDEVFDTLMRQKALGARLVFLIHDIIPLTHPGFFFPAHVARFEKWFQQVTEVADYLIFNSRYTQSSVQDYLGRQTDQRIIGGAVVHLGHDLSSTIPHGDMTHIGLSHAFRCSRNSFLCVGTLEPRKNIAVVLDAFDRLWSNGHDIALILIGRAGWLCEDLLNRIRTYREKGHRLFWFNDVDDANLALAYQRASGLIFPSLVEGFGLPLVEALSQGLSVIASDIPVFGEIAGDHARYFDPARSDVLANEVLAVLSQAPDHRAEGPFVWPSWEDSTRELLTVLQHLVVDDARDVPPPAPQPDNPSLPAG